MKKAKLILTPLILLIAFFAKGQTAVIEINKGGKYQTDQTVVLQQLSADVKIIGNIATTTLRMSFYNNSDRLKEGRLTFPLPEGVSVSGFSLDINGVLRKAVPVEKEKATAVFESIERRQVDPGILEKTEGNNFRTRIYPLNANAARTIEITYNQELVAADGKLFYYLPLANQTLQSFQLSASVYETISVPKLLENPDGGFVFEKKGNVWQAGIKKTNFAPSHSLKIEFPQQDNAPQTLMKKRDGSSWYFLTNVHVTPPPAIKKEMRQLTILWDNSFSGMKRDHKKEKEFLQKLLATKNNINIALYAVATTTKKMGDFTNSNGAIDGLLKTIDEMVYDGATDFGSIPAGIANNGEVLFFTDGLSNFGEWRQLPKTPVHTLVATPVADYSKLHFISNTTGGQLINLNQTDLANAVQKVEAIPYRFLGVKYLYDVTDVNPATSIVFDGNLLVTGIAKKLPVTITLQFGFGNKVEKELTVVLNEKEMAADWNIETFWAQQKIAALEVYYDQNKTEIARLSKDFGIVTKNTSLIVLENVEDYVKYNITPPADLLQEYKAIIKERREEQDAAWGDYLAAAKSRITDLKSWWNTDFSKVPKIRRPVKDPRMDGRSMAVDASPVADAVSQVPPPPAAAPANATVKMGVDEIAGAPGTSSQMMVRPADSETREEASLEEVNNVRVPRGKVRTIDVQSDAEYMKEFDNNLSADKAYKVYLGLRSKYQTTPSFYFDIANWFYIKNDRETALTVLGNLVEMELEDAELYKTVAYLLKKYGAYDKELIVAKKVLDWRPMDPQSYRDYALALQDNGHYQNALDTLYAALTQSYTEETMGRDEGIEEVLLMEINNIAAKHGARVSTRNIDKALLFKMPVDIRVVLNWNMDNMDIDLHVTDPKNEECYYGSNQTSTGGRISNDFTDGFGPEQFLLKKAIKGKYQIKTNFFGERRVTVSGPPTLMAEVYLRYASGQEERKVVVFQDANDAHGNSGDGKILIAEFEF